MARRMKYCKAGTYHFHVCWDCMGYVPYNAEPDTDGHYRCERCKNR